MTEQEWLTSDDPQAMLTYLHGPATRHEQRTGQLRETTYYGDPPCKVSDRKLRLFACAYISSHRPESEWGHTLNEYYAAAETGRSPSSGSLPRGATRQGLAWAEDRSDTPPRPVRAALLRDIVGNPWKPVTLPAGEKRTCSCSMYGRNGWVVGRKGEWEKCDCCQGSGLVWPPCPWLAWRDRTIPRMVQAIYDERAFDRLPILADALEDAGCADEAILQHCRGMEMIPDGIYPPENMLLRGPHVRGCWVVDLLLGKT